MGSTMLQMDQAGYAALSQDAAVQSRPDASALAIDGVDRADFLHRMTTNDIKTLRPGQAAVTVLTSPTARIRFVFTVLCREQELLLLPASGQAPALARHLRSQIFFMDKVKVRELDYVRRRIMGPRAGETLAHLGWPVDLLSPEGWQEREGVFLVWQQRYDVPGFELAAPAVQTAANEEEMRHAGAAILADEVAYTARRIELGRPAPGYELTEEYNPLEAGLAWVCAKSKGCYTGQEVIARQINYGKMTKTLMGLRCEAEVTAGAGVTVDGRSVGAVTSAAYSPALQSHIALAVIKRPHNEPGVAAMAGAVACQVTALPFIEA